MRKNRRIILGLVALGRITPAEGERLLAVSNAGRDGLWVIVVFIALAVLMQLDPRVVLPQLAHAAHAFLPGLAAHHALALRLMGGIR